MRVVYILKEIEGVPGEFQLLPFGPIEIEGEVPAVVDEESVRSVIAEFRRRGNDMVIDYEHQTLGGGEAPAAGWIKAIVDKGKDGIHVMVEWTEKAKEYLKNKEYKYFSPVMWLEKITRRVVKIENVALTNFPKVNNLKPIMAKMGHDFDVNHKTKEGETMIEKLKKLLGLAADAAEEAVAGAVELLVAKVKTLEARPEVVACKEVLAALGAKAEATKEELVQIVGSLKESTVKKAGVEAELVALKKDHEDLKKKWDERTADELIAKALSTGRITPAQVTEYGKEMALKRPDEFTRVVLSRREGSEIPLKDLPHDAGDIGGKASERMEKIVAKMMESDKSLSYTAALGKAQAENPVLAKEVATELAALRG